MKNEYTVAVGTEKTGIKEYMENNLQLSSRRIKKLLKEKKITINGKTAYWDNTVRGGDLLTIDLAEKIETQIIPQDIPVEVLYEDEFLLAVNKPPYRLMHPTANHDRDTLGNALRYYFDLHGIQAPVRFLSRLDMNTSGAVIVPKQAEVHSKLMLQLEQKKIQKKYLAVVEGIVVPAEGTINEPIGPDLANHIKRAVSEAGVEAVTLYNTVKALREAALLGVVIITGRTHQIRVHMSHIGHPIIGDELYGTESSVISRQALHAYSISFEHPVTGEKINVEAPVPDDMKKLIEVLSE